MKGKAWWVVLVVAGALAATAGFLRTSADRPARPEELEGSRPDDPPAIRGVITQVEPLAPPPSPAGSGTGATAGAAAGAGSDHWRILVEEHRTAGNGAQPSNGAGSTRSPLPIWLTVDDQTQVGASVGRHFVPLPAEGALQPGQSVRAWIRGGIRESYPAQADAGTVLVEPYLEGIVGERAPAAPGDGSGRARLLVRGRPLPPHVAGTGGAVWIAVDDHTVILREDGRHGSLNDLQAGASVTLWAAFPMLMSDPPQAYAPLVVVRQGP